MDGWIDPNAGQVNVGENLDRIVDEWTYAEHLEREVYMARMVGVVGYGVVQIINLRRCKRMVRYVMVPQVDHWSTFVAEEDFEALAATGVSHVRVPVAYW